MNYKFTRQVSMLVSSKYKAITYNGFNQEEVFQLKFTYTF